MDMQPMDTTSRRALGPTIGLVIILGIILAGGVYFYTTTKDDVDYGTDGTTATSSVNGSSESDEPTSTSTEPDAIEADLDSYTEIDTNF